MSRITLVAWGTVALALVTGALTFLVPAPAEGAAAFHSSFALSITITITQLGAAALFMWGLKGFKHQLRVAYGLICAGIALLGFSHLQLPIITYFDLSRSVYVEGGVIIIPYILPTLLIFFGVRHFAKLFQIKTKWLSFWFVMGLGVACAAVAAGLVSVLLPSRGQELIASIVISGWTAILLVSILIIVLAIKRTAGPIYRNALRWFAIAQAIDLLSVAAYAFVLILFGNQTEFTQYGGTILPSVIGAFLFLRSGYVFKLINEDHAKKTTNETVTMLDAVAFAASQASNPAQIDSSLDALRLMTSEPGMNANALTPEQQKILKRIYADIEHYLVEQEPLRRLTTEEVRRKGAQYFGMGYDEFVGLIKSPE